MKKALRRDLFLAMLGFAFGSLVITSSAGILAGREEFATDRAAERLI
jgi:hypothetical protein